MQLLVLVGFVLICLCMQQVYLGSVMLGGEAKHALSLVGNAPGRHQPAANAHTSTSLVPPPPRARRPAVRDDKIHGQHSQQKKPTAKEREAARVKALKEASAKLQRGRTERILALRNATELRRLSQAAALRRLSQAAARAANLSTSGNRVETGATGGGGGGVTGGGGENTSGRAAPTLPAAESGTADVAAAVSPMDASEAWTEASAGESRRLLRDWWASIDSAAKLLGLNVSEQAKNGAGGMRFTRSSAWRKKCRRFAVGNRKDYRGTVRDALTTLGLCETSSAHYDVYWGEQWAGMEPFTSGHVMPNAVINSIPGFRTSFGDKVAFAGLHEECLTRQAMQTAQAKAATANHTRSGGGGGAAGGGDGDSAAAGWRRQPPPEPIWCGWTKRGFSYERRGDEIDGPLAAFRAHAKQIAQSLGGDRNEFPQLWILKPQQGFNQIGISMVYLQPNDLASEGATRRWLEAILTVDGSWTLQEYVKHPLLYRGRKFDLRVWALITSVDPLRLYILDRGFPKVSTVPYDTDAAVVGRHCLSRPHCACMHVRMPMGEGCDKAKLIDPYPESTEAMNFKRGVRLHTAFDSKAPPPSY